LVRSRISDFFLFLQQKEGISLLPFHQSSFLGTVLFVSVDPCEELLSFFYTIPPPRTRLSPPLLNLCPPYRASLNAPRISLLCRPFLPAGLSPRIGIALSSSFGYFPRSRAKWMPTGLPMRISLLSGRTSSCAGPLLQILPPCLGLSFFFGVEPASTFPPSPDWEPSRCAFVTRCVLFFFSNSLSRLFFGMAPPVL